MAKYDELFGNWEEKNVIGTRVEIDKNTLAILWQGGIVLKTKYKATKEKDGKITLKLKQNGLRYEGSVSDYAVVTSLYYEAGSLYFIKNFPITGESTEILTKTENSRYGNYRIEDEKILPLLEGEWKSTNGFYELSFLGDTLIFGGKKIKIHALRSNYEGAIEEYKIADQNPAKHEIAHLANLKYSGGVITANEIILDGPTVTIVFEKCVAL